MLLTRKKITPKYSQSINQIINNDLLSEIKQISGKAGKDGRDGKSGLNGKDGYNGVNGKDGLDGVNGKDGINGRDGKDGRDGKAGKAGKDGRSITSERLHARVLFFDYSDGTTAKIHLSFPAGDISNPGFAGGGMEPPVKDIRAGENVEVTETNGKYIISALPNAGVYNWIDYVTGYVSIPTLLKTISEGDVYSYSYKNGTLYRLVPSGSELDSFYSNFDDSTDTLSDLVISKGINI